MIGDISISSVINEKHLKALLENASFPLTKAEATHKAEANGVPSSMLSLLRKLPSRFYRSKGELISQCISTNIRYHEISSAINYETIHGNQEEVAIGRFNKQGEELNESLCQENILR